MATKITRADQLQTKDIIRDPEGNKAVVRRYHWIDHERGRLTTDLGVKVVAHNQTYPVIGREA